MAATAVENRPFIGTSKYVVPTGSFLAIFDHLAPPGRCQAATKVRLRASEVIVSNKSDFPAWRRQMAAAAPNHGTAPTRLWPLAE